MTHRVITAATDIVADHETFRGDELIRALSSRPKTIPNKYYYDEAGLLLFEALCKQPEYYLATAEFDLLHRHAPDIAAIVGDCDVVDLGCGSAKKTLVLLSALGARAKSMRYTAFDLDKAIVDRAITHLAGLFPLLFLDAVVDCYDRGIHALPEKANSRLFLLLGSSITNLWDHELESLLQSLRQRMGPGEFLLIGADLAKPASIVEGAYNDAMGAAAQTNLNVLEHINWRFSANFDIRKFQHVAAYNAVDRRGESYLRSIEHQNVRIRKLGFTLTLERGETVLTEIERKYLAAELRSKIEEHGFAQRGAWIHAQHQYGLFLFERSQLQAFP